jgi:hypothetical protein
VSVKIVVSDLRHQGFEFSDHLAALSRFGKISLLFSETSNNVVVDRFEDAVGSSDKFACISNLAAIKLAVRQRDFLAYKFLQVYASLEEPCVIKCP